LSHDLQNRNIKNECFVIEDNLKVQFTQCAGDNTETSNFLKISDDCEPEITLDFNSSCLRVGETATMTFSVRIGPAGGIPLKNQRIVISVPDGFKVTPEEPETDEGGIATSTIECLSDNAEGDIDYMLLSDYYLTEISASAGGELEYNRIAPKRIQVKGIPRHIKSCPKVASIELIQPSVFYFDVNDTPILLMHCFDDQGQSTPCNCKDTEYVIESFGNQNVVSVVNGILTATNPGYALIKVRCTDWDGSVVESSNSVGLSVSYQGRINAEGEIDWNNYDYGCCCDLDGDQMMEHCWRMEYTGYIDMKFWLHYDSTRPAFGKITGGCETQTWDMYREPSNCRSDSYEYVLTSLTNYESNTTTGEILQGQSFFINFAIYQWPSAGCVKISNDALPNDIDVGGQLSGDSVLISGIDYVAHACFEHVITGTGVLH
jgi:hypothetical protein